MFFYWKIMALIFWRETRDHRRDPMSTSLIAGGSVVSSHLPNLNTLVSPAAGYITVKYKVLDVRISAPKKQNEKKRQISSTGLQETKIWGETMPVAMQHAVQYATRTATAVPARAAQWFQCAWWAFMSSLDIHLSYSMTSKWVARWGLSTNHLFFDGLAKHVGRCDAHRSVWVWPRPDSRLATWWHVMTQNLWFIFGWCFQTIYICIAASSKGRSWVHNLQNLPLPSIWHPKIQAFDAGIVPKNETHLPTPVLCACDPLVYVLY